MEFNATKCHVLTITHKQNYTKFPYSLNQQVLSHVDSHPYLGVTLDRKMNWIPHIHTVVNKATKALNFLSRNIHKTPPHIKTFAYQVFVRPRLEYASQVWSPTTTAGVNRLEAVQRCSARFLTSRHKRRDSPTEMLAGLKWSPLANRRDRAKTRPQHAHSTPTVAHSFFSQ